MNGGEITESATAAAPTFRVSLDGGQTWLKDENGQDLTFPVSGSSDGTTFTTDPIRVKDIFVSFDFASLPSQDELTLTSGDRFDLSPKKSLYWVEPTRGEENITPMLNLAGVDNQNRLSGGKLAAYFNIRDDACGRYLDELDALAKSLVWEVNRQHSQGSGLEKLTYAHGEIKVAEIDQPLSSAQSGSVFYDRLAELSGGNLNLYFYDAKTGQQLNVSDPTDDGTNELLVRNGELQLFGKANFNPSTFTLEDVRDQFNAVQITIYDASSSSGLSTVQAFNAEIQDGKLQVSLNSACSDQVTFAFGQDTTGLLASLGLNSLLSGDSAANLGLCSDVATDYTKVNAGRVNGGYETNEGDNTIANAIGQLATKAVKVNTYWMTATTSIPEYYAGLVSTVGSDKLHSETNKDYHTALADAALERKDSVAGVNLDEEMTHLVKYQSAYTAAAKLITTADEMLGVLLGLKQ
ncbi:MAG: hypothetical protein IJS50_00130 [Desulfovibrio sp.]|nr:hypothetical protein [Desulfovibrio sp.]